MVCLRIVSSQIWTIHSILFQRYDMARKMFSTIRLGYASFFYRAVQVNGNSRGMCIATCVAYSKNIVLGYDGTLPQRYSSFASALFGIQDQPFHSCSPQVVDDCLHRARSKMQTAIVAIRTIQA